MSKQQTFGNNLHMRKISLVFQELLKFCLLFLISFVWLRYFTRKFVMSIILAVLISAFISLAIFLFKRSKTKKVGLKLKEKEDAENIFFSLACKNNPIDDFVKMASKRHKNIVKHKNYIVINETENHTKTLLWLDLSFAGLTEARFMEIYNKIKSEKAGKIIICCKEISDKNLSVFCNNFKEKFLLLNQYDTYEKLYKEYEYFPEITIEYSKEKKMMFKDFLAYSFNKKRTKGYLFSAFILVLASLFVRASLYYCIIASLLVVFAILSQFNPYFNVKNNTQIL